MDLLREPPWLNHPAASGFATPSRRRSRRGPMNDQNSTTGASLTFGRARRRIEGECSTHHGALSAVGSLTVGNCVDKFCGPLKFAGLRNPRPAARLRPFRDDRPGRTSPCRRITPDLIRFPDAPDRDFSPGRLRPLDEGSANGQRTVAPGLLHTQQAHGSASDPTYFPPRPSGQRQRPDREGSSWLRRKSTSITLAHQAPTAMPR